MSLTSLLPKPEFKFSPHPSEPAQIYKSGGLFCLMLGERVLCDYTHWGFDSCGIDLLHNFKSYAYHGLTAAERRDLYDKGKMIPTNFDLFRDNFDELCKFLYNTSPRNYRPQEFLMAISDMQVTSFGSVLNDDRIKEVDRWENKSHGPSDIHLYRISLKKDFKFHDQSHLRK
jgi:hypothetical protein